jgi:hypothetical protein
MELQLLAVAHLVKDLLVVLVVIEVLLAHTLLLAGAGVVALLVLLDQLYEAVMVVQELYRQFQAHKFNMRLEVVVAHITMVLAQFQEE